MIHTIRISSVRQIQKYILIRNLKFWKTDVRVPPFVEKYNRVTGGTLTFCSKLKNSTIKIIKTIEKTRQNVIKTYSKSYSYTVFRRHNTTKTQQHDTTTTSTLILYVFLSCRCFVFVVSLLCFCRVVLLKTVYLIFKFR